MDLFMNFLENQTVQAWIAPIIVAIIIALGGYAINVFRKKKQAEKNINTYSAAEDKLLESLLPFFIQEIKLDKNLIVDVRKAIIREYGLDKDKFITIEETKNILILNILKTSFIKEEDKKRLVDGTYKTFDTFKVDNMEEREERENYVNIKEKEIQRYKSRLVSVVISMSTICLILLISVRTTEISNKIELPEKSSMFMVLTGAIIGCIAVFLSLFNEFQEKKMKNKLKEYEMILRRNKENFNKNEK